jgi:hypothetical protein
VKINIGVTVHLFRVDADDFASGVLATQIATALEEVPGLCGYAIVDDLEELETVDGGSA